MIERAVVAALSRDWRIVGKTDSLANSEALVSVCRRFRCTVFELTEENTGCVVFQWFVFGSSFPGLLANSRAPSLAAAMADCEAFCRLAGGAAE